MQLILVNFSGDGSSLHYHTIFLTHSTKTIQILHIVFTQSALQEVKYSKIDQTRGWTRFSQNKILTFL